MKTWTQEVEEYREKIKDMTPEEAEQFLWTEHIRGRLSKKAHDWLVRWIDE